MGVVFALYLILVIQLAYPRNRSLPLARLPNGTRVGAKSTQQIEYSIENINKADLTIKADTKSYDVTLQTIGNTIDSTTAKSYTDYPLLRRLIPLSILLSEPSRGITRKVDQQRMHAFSEKIVAENTVSPKNASYTLDTSGVYTVTASADGIQYKLDETKQYLSNVTPVSDQTVVIRGSQVKPVIVEDMLADGVKKLNAIRSQTIALDSTTIPGSVLSSWTSLKIDDAKKVVEVTYDVPAIKEWLKGVKSGLVTAKPKVVTYLDRVVVSEVEGSPGKSIDFDKTSAALVTAIKDSKTTAAITYVDTPVTTQTVQTYSPTNTGLTYLIQDWQAKYPGMQASVVYKELGGQGRYAAVSPNQSMFAASLYKLYVAKYVFDAISSGKITATEQIRPDKNTQQCIDAMLVVSDNACPETLMSRFGKPTIDAATIGDGFTATSMSNTATTATDTAAFLERLQAGGLLNATDTSTYLDALRRQIYKQAIPDGSRGAAVLDKVGFYGAYWHDAAIVQKGLSRYVLVVMTKNASPKAISELAASILKFQ